MEVSEEGMEVQEEAACVVLQRDDEEQMKPRPNIQAQHKQQ